MGLSVLFPMVLVDESLEDRSYLDILYPGFHIMANRGSKNVSALFDRRKCTLFWFPSVFQDTQCSPEEVE